MRRNAASVAVIICSLGILVSGFVLLSGGGYAGYTRKPGGIFPGCLCHGNADGIPNADTRVWIEGPDSVWTGMEYYYAVKVSKDSLVAAGFNAAVFLGDVDTVQGEGTRLDEIPQEIVHSFPKLATTGDTISWAFLYRAPDVPGTDTVYATGNAVNLSGDPDSGDIWNFADELLVRVVQNPNSIWNPVLAASGFELKGNYPNPFNPSTVIRYRLAHATRVTLKIYNSLGLEVVALVNQIEPGGVHDAQWDGRDGRGRPAGSGVYFCRLETSSFSQTKKMLLLR
jgi:hypothetical protein